MMRSTYHSSNDLTPYRRTHYKRFSTSKSSSETIQTLPEYLSPPGWNNSVGPPPLAGAESDRPPDYPETADEADADTEGDQEEYFVYGKHHLVHPPPRRLPTHISRRTRALTAASAPFLDTLLERSVHALEMSNSLLRTTISTQSSLPALLSSENECDNFLEVRARNLSTRIRVNSGVHETWMDHLEEISQGVDRLFREEEGGRTVSRSDEGAVSQSLPTSTRSDLRHQRRPSILELSGSSSNSHLRYSHPTRDVLVAPAPRALTQYVESTTDPQLITLPSTLGLRTSGSSHSVHSRGSSSALSQEIESQLMASIFPETQSGNTPAYHLLSNLVKRSGSLTPPSSTRVLRSHHRCASASPTGTVRGAQPSFSPSSARTLYSSSDRSRAGIQGWITRSRSETGRGPPTPPTPLPTLPADGELSSPSSESSDSPTGYRTVQSLRKILGDHPSSISVNTLQRKDPKFHRARAFFPITPPPAPTQGTSTATASISRLYTKGRHSMSTRPPSPPAHSSLKVRSVPPTPAPSPSSMSLSEAFGSGVARVIGSTPSTLKRISFAVPPESYSGSQPGTSKLRVRKGRKKSKEGKDRDKEEVSGWFKTLLHGGLSSGAPVGMGSREERIEERMARGWGSRPGYGALDDWAV